MSAVGLENGRDLVVLSDLHMSSGVDGLTGRFSRHECFRDDAAFARFLDDLAERGRRDGRNWRLLILGDLVDFLHVESRPRRGEARRPDTSEAATLAKLERIAEGHRVAFQALGTFAAAGFPISIVPGNHDVELVRSSAQERFRDLAANASGRADAAGRIDFHPWFYYLPGVLYAEHGSQYHDLNAFRSFLRPYRGEDEIDLPLGSHLTLYLLDVADRIGWEAEGPPSVPEVLAAFRRDPSLVTAALRPHARLLGKALPRATTGRRGRPRDEEYALREYSVRLGLSYETVTAIERLAATRPMSVEVRALRQLVLEPLAARWRRHHGSPPPSPVYDYLHRAALAIHHVLKSEEKSVPFYVFGHAHRAERTALGAGATGAYYLNTGTWSSIVPPALKQLGRQARFTFVEVVRDDGDGAPEARLFRWNDAERCAESYELVQPQRPSFARGRRVR